MLQGFKQFMLRGNVLDLAVAVVMGAAFGSVVTALVKDLITPFIAAVVGKPDFSAIAFTVNRSKFPVGDFINALVSFIRGRAHARRNAVSQDCRRGPAGACGRPRTGRVGGQANIIAPAIMRLRPRLAPLLGLLRRSRRADDHDRSHLLGVNNAGTGRQPALFL